MIETERLILNAWQERHFLPFAALHADPEVMADLGGVMDQTAARKKFERYCQAGQEHKISRWAVENKQGEFVGYAGVMPRMDCDHPLGKHYEIGWRFKRRAWGHGYATESAKSALKHAVTEMKVKEVVSYTSPENLRSQAVMERLGLERTPSRDFVLNNPSGLGWYGLVWVAPNELHIDGEFGPSASCQ